MLIKDLPSSERPRERLISLGKNYLTIEELLSLIIKTGSKDKSAKDLAGEIIKLGNIKYITYDNLIKLKGIGPAKAVDILASIELGIRLNNEIRSLNNVKFNSPEIIFNYYKDTLGTKKQEHFYCIYLDTKKKIIKEKLLFIGTIDRSMVTPREVLKEALLCDAASIICIHNHPSGIVLPSKEDILMTKGIDSLSKNFGIRVVDHIIISEYNYYSLYENGDYSV